MSEDLDDELPRRCRRVRPLLPRLASGDLAAPRRRVAEHHIERCAECAEALAAQAAVAEGLGAIGQAVTTQAAAPPPELLASILAQVDEPGMRARAAAPLRGAVSGARPGLSVGFGIGTLALVGLAAWAGWRIGTAIARRRT